MSSHRRTTAWSLITSYGTIAVTVVSGFVLPPLYLDHISSSLYGAWLATGNLVAWLSALDPGLSAALQQRVANAHGRGDSSKMGAWIGAGVTIGLGLALVVAGTGLAVEMQLTALLDLGEPIDFVALKEAFKLAVIGTSLSVFAFTFSAINHGLQETRISGLCSVISNALAIALIATLVLTGHGIQSIGWGIVLRGAGWLVSNAVFLFVWAAKRHGFRLSVQLESIKELLKLSSYTFLGRIGATLSNHVDSFVVARYLGADTVTVFEMTRRAPNGARPFVERISNAVMPSVSSLHGDHQIDKLRAILTRLLRVMVWVVALMIAGFACFNDDFVQLWVGNKFFAGTTINLLILAGLLVGIVVRSLSNLCMALGNIEANSVVSFIESLLFAVLLYLGVRYFGLLGVVLAPIVAKLCVSAWYYPTVFARLVELPRPDLALLGIGLIKALMLAGALAGMFWTVDPAGWVQFIAYCLAFVGLYVAGLSVISKQFRQEVQNLVAAIQRRVTSG